DHLNKNNLNLHVTLTANPSHLEAVGPVVEGRARAKQREKDDTESRGKVVPFLVHGDAAFAGQGLVAETLNLSQLTGYRTGGTVHFIINNQIGFTTLPRDSRSTRYSTDIAKMIEAPIFHVNGDDPEACVFVTKLALEFRQTFKKDVVVDMICYRRHGHNEGDEPAFTQPILYKKIKDHPSVRALYQKRIMNCCPELQVKEAELSASYQEKLQQAMDSVKENKTDLRFQPATSTWDGIDKEYHFKSVDTSVGRDRLKEIAKALTSIPDGFNLNPKVARKLNEQLKQVEENGAIDWGFAELLAFGSLLRENHALRLSGQDSERGTFSHRHAVWSDMETQEAYKPLNHIHEDQARFCVYNSSLSEAGVLGFEYGYSLEDPNMLILWEAQFGDFANGAQVIIDQFIVSSQAKWQRTSGLVMLLPHGYEGQGPEHSNAYLERYLQAGAEENIQVCNLTTTAQYFHMLRRQVKRSFRRPMILMSPKSLLRHPAAVSLIGELEKGSFHTVLQDPEPPKRTTRLVLCSGKVYYDLAEQRRRDGVDGVALVRMEQLYPFDRAAFLEVFKKHESAGEICWVQEEPKNRGAWSFISPILREIFPGKEIRYIGRAASASPATGSLKIHIGQQVSLVRAAVAEDLDEGDES
ncbi:MAG: 2-oxoglutarate dehydrogenase E1 component, partial [Planctomycetes bacterium]|nr:2-oxoglutarate dehydrogenase E1 component [Planctomycetota bacterium]